MDEIERLVRGANPSRTRRHSPVSERGERDLAAILGGDVPAAETVPVSVPQRLRVPVLVSTMAAVLVVFLIVATAGQWLQSSPASAAPAPLKATPVSGDLAQVFRRLMMSAEASADPSPAMLHETSFETWSAAITVGDDDTTVAVQPEEHSRSWSDDLSGSLTVRAGEPRWGVPAKDGLKEPGTILDRQTFAAGEFPLLFAEAPPSDVDAMRAYLIRLDGLSEQPTAAELFKAVQDLRAERPLSGAESAAVLGVLSETDGIELMGRVTDRLGRSGVAIKTEVRSGGAFRDILVFDEDSGTLLSSEEVYLGGLPDLSLPSPSVMNYIAWKDPS